MLRDVPQGRRRLHDRVPGHTAPPPVSVIVNLAQLGWIDQTRHSSIDKATPLQAIRICRTAGSPDVTPVPRISGGLWFADLFRRGQAGASLSGPQPSWLVAAALRHRSVMATPMLASMRRSSGRESPMTLLGSPSMPSTNGAPSPSMLNAP